MRPVTLACLALALAAPAVADPLISFATGPAGDLGGFHATVAGIEIDAVGGHLFRWSSVYPCCGQGGVHDDLGFGILSPGESAGSGADPELDNVGGHREYLRLHNTTGRPWTAVYFTSVNNQSALDIFAHDAPGGGSLYHVTTRPDTETQRLALRPDDYDAPYLWVTPSDDQADNYSLVWGVDTLERPAPVPEPDTLTLLGFGLLILVVVRAAWLR